MLTLTIQKIDLYVQLKFQLQLHTHLILRHKTRQIYFSNAIRLNNKKREMFWLLLFF